MKHIFFAYIAVINVLSFILMGWDKARAVKGGRRTPEKVLLIIDLLGGALGGILGMSVFRHKTRHAKFYILVPLMLILWFFIFFFITLKGEVV